MRRKVCVGLLLGLSFLVELPCCAQELDEITWKQVAESAKEFVNRERPPPVALMAHGKPLSNSRLVVAHYFPPFPISIDNRDSASDYYSKNYLVREGEGGKFASQGGYLRERPLPAGPWPSAEYQEINLAIDVLRAERIGIDAFGVDLLQINSGPLWSTAVRMLKVTKHVSARFRIVPEPDMGALTEVTETDLATALAQFCNQPASLHLADGRMLVIPFLAEARSSKFWEALVDNMKARGCPIALIPDFLDDSSLRHYSAFSYEMSVWGVRDVPSTAAYPQFVSSVRQTGSKVMLPVAAQDFRPKSGLFWEASNLDTFVAQWKIAIRSGVDAVHLITWNDYSEATEISPSSGTQYVIYDLCAYFIYWFKTGHEPALSHDVLLYSQRRQIFSPDSAVSGAIPFGEIGTAPVVNNIEVLSMLVEPGEISLSGGAGTVHHYARKGIDSTIAAVVAGATPSFSLSRRGATVVSGTSAYVVEQSPKTLDALYVGGSTDRAYTSIP